MRLLSTVFSGLLAVVTPGRLCAQQVVSVEVTPAHASVTAGDTIRFHVSAKDSAGRPVSTPAVWIAPSFDIAGADSTGLVTTIRPGQTYVFALVGGAPGFALLDVAERGPARLAAPSARVPPSSRVASRLRSNMNRETKP